LNFFYLCFVTIQIYGQKNFVQKQKHVLAPNDGIYETAVIGEKSTSLIDAAIGTTWYDVQSYNNLGQRIYEYPDGTVGAIWQSAGEDLTPNRGTGYNYFDGAAWGDPIPHLGADERTGWPTYAPWGENGEIIMHYGDPGEGVIGPMKLYRREIKGEGDWTVTELFGPDDLSIVWGSMTTSGENNEFIHVLAYTYDNPYLGQDNAVLYYRSSDGAQTWEIEHELIDGIGIDYYPNGLNLAFSWAQAVGENIAFVYGPTAFDGKIFRSDDNGDSWDDILFYESPYPEGGISTEDFACGDGTSTIVLDSEGNAHVVFSKMVYAYNATGGGGYYPQTEGVIYWTEGMDVMDSTHISSYTNQFLIDAGQLIGYMLPDPQTGSYEILDPNEQFSYGCSFTSFPQMGIDANDNMFVTYQALAPGFDNTNQNYRHIHVTSSWDGGANWNEPVDLNTDILFSISECVYPAISAPIDDKIHILFQEDYDPGISEWLTNHDPCENTMKHMEFDKDFFVGVENHEQLTQEMAVSSCYPNPAVGTTQLNIRMENSGATSVVISNMIGQTVNEMDLGVLNQGSNPVHIQISDLSSGVYYITVKTENQKNTQKLIVR